MPQLDEVVGRSRSSIVISSDSTTSSDSCNGGGDSCRISHFANEIIGINGDENVS